MFSIIGSKGQHYRSSPGQTPSSLLTVVTPIRMRLSDNTRVATLTAEGQQQQAVLRIFYDHHLPPSQHLPRKPRLGRGRSARAKIFGCRNIRRKKAAQTVANLNIRKTFHAAPNSLISQRVVAALKKDVYVKYRAHSFTR